MIPPAYPYSYSSPYVGSFEDVKKFVPNAKNIEDSVQKLQQKVKLVPKYEVKKQDDGIVIYMMDYNRNIFFIPVPVKDWGQIIIF